LTGYIIDGRLVGTYPDHYYLRSPDRENCIQDEKGGYPEGYEIASISNLTFSSRCVPLSYEDAEHEEKERKIHDQNRCPAGFKLVDITILLVDIDQEPEEGYGNVGKCERISNDDN
jgi:hypothetical protein